VPTAIEVGPHPLRRTSRYLADNRVTFEIKDQGVDTDANRIPRREPVFADERIIDPHTVLTPEISHVELLLNLDDACMMWRDARIVQDQRIIGCPSNRDFLRDLISMDKHGSIIAPRLKSAWSGCHRCKPVSSPLRNTAVACDRRETCSLS